MKLTKRDIEKIVIELAVYDTTKSSYFAWMLALKLKKYKVFIQIKQKQHLTDIRGPLIGILDPLKQIPQLTAFATILIGNVVSHSYGPQHFINNAQVNWPDTVKEGLKILPSNQVGKELSNLAKEVH